MKNLLRALTLLSILLAVPAWAGDGIWTPAGPPGTRGFAGQDLLVLDPFSPSTLYLAYAGPDSSGLWKSTDRGSRWTSINAGLDTSAIASLAADPFTPGTLWALVGFPSGGSLRKSTDGGLTWTEVNHLPPGGLFFNLFAPDPRVRDRLWATDREALYRSDDGGVSWELIAVLGSSGELHSFTFDPKDPNVLYVAGRFHLLKSTDAGAHWSEVSQIRGLGFNWVEVAPSRPATLYAQSTEGAAPPQTACVRSDDGGITWTPIPFPNPEDLCFNLVVDPGNHLKIWALSGGRLYISENGGATWAVRASSLEELAPYNLRRDPATDFLYTLSPDGPVRSADGGVTWQVVNQGITQVLLGPILAVPGRQTALLAAVRFTSDVPETPLLRGRNRGRFWKETSLERVTALARDPRTPSRILAASYSLLHESRDGGATWTLLSTMPKAAISIAVHPIDSRRIYVGTYDSGVFQSRDGGRTWQAASAGLIFPEPCDRIFCPDLPTTELTIDPRNPNVLHALFIGTLVRSLNGGRRWARIGGLEEGPLVALARDPANPQVLYAAGVSTLFKSGDGGASWSRIDGNIGAPNPLLGFDFLDLAVDPRLGGIVYASTRYRGVLRSRDGGATWEEINAGLPLLDVSRLEIDPSVPGGLFAVANGAGIWQFRTVE